LSGFFSGEFILGGHTLEHTARYCNFLIKFDAELDPNQPLPCEIVSDIRNPDLPEDQISVFPNPANDHIRIETSLPNGIQEVSIYNMNGRIMYTELLVDTNTVSVNTSRWPSGMYAIRTEVLSEQVVKTFVIVR